MQVRVGEIKIKKRVRKDLGELSPLMSSLRDHGLMNPVVVNGRRELVAGHRRLEAARRLGWDCIEATIVETPGELAMLELELEENTLRRDFSPEELAEGLRRLELLRNPGLFRRLWLRLKSWWGRLVS